ncbi:MAG: M23 family metallopeptidase [Alphaproteobacteria bacterium]|nr:M23 family metallopeptidase [Alphaproteobacteria bacterium]MCB9792829.1 M23 family metallopeptidase [Alphaproteobacteria bacterium]
MRLSLLVPIALIACAAPTADTGEVEAAPESSHHAHEAAEALPERVELPLDRAVANALDLGVVEADVIYTGLLPYVVSEDEAIATWGVITSDAEGLHVSWMDQVTGEPLELNAPAPENIVDFVAQNGLDRADTWGSSVGSYNSYPWSWRLPMEAGTFTLTCGYGCGAHTGGIYYSTDWANGSAGHKLESPASGFVMYRSSNSGAYGYQLIVEGGSAGSGKEYYYRIAHLQSRASVTPGWWIGKGRDVGYIGNTGNSTGPHVHYEVIRATSTSGGSFSGADDLPINRWPSSSDSICGGAFASSNFAGQRNLSVTVGSNGCP